MAQQNTRARQQRQRLILILILLLVLGAGGFYFVNSKQDTGITPNQERPEGKVAIPVASRNINLGERISSNMFTVRFRSPEQVPPNILLNVENFIGRFATQPLLQGAFFRPTDVSEAGVAGGYSAIARSGKRLVVLSSSMFPGSIASLRVGDHIDLLAIGDASGSGNATGSGSAAGTSLANSSVTLQGGGAQPGDPNSAARQRARARTAGGIGLSSASATLVAENAEVMRTPQKGADTEFVVLQMTPQDAHVTTLMAATGAVMRVVFRPYNDETRLTKSLEAKITTRLPKPEADPETVTIITGTARGLARPQSELFVPAGSNASNGVQNNLPKNEMYSDTEIVATEIQQRPVAKVPLN